MPQTRLILVTSLGLANRLRAVAAGIGLLDRREDLTLEVVWEPDDGLAARYGDLFEPLEHPRVRFRPAEEVPELVAFRRPRSPRPVRAARRLAGRPRPDGDPSPAALAELLPGVRTDNADFARRFGHAALLGTCHQFFEPAVWDRFVPKPALRARVEQAAAALGPDRVGVHVRRSDNVKSWARSPLSTFLAAMRTELDRRPATRFFLATDSEDVRTALREVFGTDRVVGAGRGAVARDTRDGLEDAVVDLWGLASTDLVLGSYWSSFSEAAAHIGGVPLRTCTAEDAGGSG